MPITWRNVESANPAAGFQPLQAAGNNINNAFDIFSKVIQQRQATDQANLASMDDAAKQAYLDSVQGAGTPEELAALQASGALKGQYQALSAANRAVVRPAVEARNDSLVNRQRGTEKFGWERANEGRAVTAEQRAAQVAADAALAAPLLRNKLVDDLVTSKSQRDVAVTNANSQAVSAGAAASNADTNRKQLDFQSQEALQKRLDSTIDARTKADLTIASKEGSQFVIDELAKVVKDPKQLKQLLTSFGQMARSPEFTRVNPTDALNALMGDISTGGSIRNFFWDGTGDGAVGKLRDALKDSPSSRAAAETRAAQVAALDTRIEELKNSLYPNRSKPVDAATGQAAPVVAPEVIAPAPAVAAAPVARALRFTKEDPALEAKLVKELREQTTTGKIMSSESRQYMQFVQALKAKAGNEEEAKRRAASLLERENPTNPEDVAARKRQLEDRAEAELRRLNRTIVK